MKNRYALIISVLLTLLLVFALFSCGKADVGTPETAPAASGTEGVGTKGETADLSSDETAADPGASEDTAAPETKAPETSSAGKETLVVYFSATGTTKAVAEKIAKITDADIYEITASEPYTSDDLNWHDSSSRTTKEQNDKNSRPGISGEKLSLKGYKTVYVGFPIWWGEEPRILDTFVESYDFSGITLIPFCTSSSSGIGRSGKNLAENAGSGNWLDGKRFGAGASESELRSWIDSLK